MPKKTKQDQHFFRSILLSTHMWIKSDHRDSVCEYGGKLGRHFILEAPLAHLKICKTFLPIAQNHKSLFDYDQ